MRAVTIHFVVVPLLALPHERPGLAERRAKFEQ